MFWKRKKTFNVDLRRLAEIAELSGSDFEEQFQAELNSTTDDLAGQIAVAVLDSGGAWTKEFTKFRNGFEKRLSEIWKPAFTIYDFVLVLATEVGQDLNLRYRPQAAVRQDHVFETLTRLHGRACLTASEIASLLRAGHATGANARWRTLNEISVVASFISEVGQDVARRYLKHQWVEIYRMAREYHEHAERLGLNIEASEVDEARKDFQKVVSEFGPEFGTPYGWAAAALGIRNPTFRDIMKATNFEHWRPYYRLANLGVHAGSRGSFFDLGLPPSLDHIPARPSHFGLADPGGNSLLSLTLATVTMMVHCMTSADDKDASDIQASIVTLAKMKLLVKLAADGDGMFVEIQAELEREVPQSTEVPRMFEEMEFGNIAE